MKYILFCLVLFFTAQIAYSNELTLINFLDLVKKENLTLKLEKSKIITAHANAIGIRLPSPMFSLIQMNTRTGITTNGFEVSQQIPFPTKLTSDHQSRSLKEEVQNQNLLVSFNTIISKAKRAFIDLWITQEKLQAMLQKKKIIEEHLKLAQSVVRSDSLLKIHLLKAESDLDFLVNEIDSLKQKIQEKQLILSEMANQNYIIFNPIALPPSLSAIPEKIEPELSPQILSLKFNAQNLKEKERKTSLSWLPDFSLKFKRMNESQMASSYNEAMIGLTLPFIYFWQPKSETAAAQSEQLQAELSISKENRMIETKITGLYTKIISVNNQLEKIKNHLLPRAEKRLKIVNNLAPRDMESLQDHRETKEAFPNLKLKELNLKSEYEDAIAELEQYLPNQGLTNE